MKRSTATIAGHGISYLSAPGEGTPVVFVHGMSLAATDWLAITRRIEGRAWFAIDLPGHGESAHEPAYSHVADSEVVGGFLSAVSGPAIVVAHSRGGQVSGLAAANNPELFLGLFLEDVTPLFFEEGPNRDMIFARSVF